jgi:hypothetical protein
MPVIVTADGRLVDPFNLRPTDIDAATLARVLARLPRFNGHTPGPHPYTVAQHCVETAARVSPRARLAALLHDAHEVFLGDWMAPVRHELQLTDGRPFCQVELAAQNAVYAAFNCRRDDDILQEVAAADSEQVADEMLAFFPWYAGGRPAHVGRPAAQIEPWPASMAERLWLLTVEMEVNYERHAKPL